MYFTCSPFSPFTPFFPLLPLGPWKKKFECYSLISLIQSTSEERFFKKKEKIYGKFMPCILLSQENLTLLEIVKNVIDCTDNIGTLFAQKIR